MKLVVNLVLVTVIGLTNVIWKVGGRGIDLKVCGDTFFTCNCGSNGYKLNIPVKQCTYFYRWKPYCKPCQDIKEDAYCSKYAHCLECNKDVDRCIQCPDNKFGQWCTGVCQCQNGGICKQDGNCECLAGFSGRHCEIVSNKCWNCQIGTSDWCLIAPSCSIPESPLNGAVSQGSYKVGDSVTYSCSEGHVLMGPQVRTCTSETKWSQHTPHCEKACSQPNLSTNLKADIIPHGNDNGNNQLAKSMRFKCENGFQISGPEVITCLPNGAWDGELPKCVTSCLFMTPPQNGHITYSDQSLIMGTVAQVQCKDGFIAIGASEITCLDNATWSHSITMCERVTYCSDPEVDPFASVHAIKGLGGGDYSQGTQLMYSCISGSIMIGSPKVQCQPDGQWSTTPPKCIYVSKKAVTCSTIGSDVMLPSKAPLRITCPGGCSKENINIWGTGIYKKDSRLCVAAIHAGMIPQEGGGSVYIVSNGNYNQFSASTSNGIRSKRSRGVSESFRFEYNDEPDDSTCQEGFTQIDDKCLLFIEIEATHKEATDMCRNLAATIVNVRPEQETTTQDNYSNILTDKGVQRVWVRSDNDLLKTLPYRGAIRTAHANNSQSMVIDPHLRQKSANSSEDPFAIMSNGSQVIENCVSFDSAKRLQMENCEHKLNFMCESDAKHLVVRDEDCADPGDIDNGRKETSGTVDGMFIENSNITFHCSSLHYIEGESVITCLSNNTWSAALPKCIRVPACREPSKINNGMHIMLPAIDTRTGLSSSVSARAAPLPAAPSRRAARRTAERSSPKPLSIPAFSSQTLPLAAQKVSVPSGHHRVGARVQFSCESQFYNLVGSSTRTCMADGQWSGRQPTCQPVCGISSSPRAPFIVNGQPTKLGQWPWQVGLARKEINLDAPKDDNERWFLYCGASLITESWVITAAHCVTYQGTTTIFPLHEIRAYFGKYYRNDTLDDEWVQIRNVAEVHVYPEFNPVIFDGDVALVRLSDPVRFNSRVQPVCLPDQSSGISDRHLQAGTVGVVTGWGTDETNEYSSTLLQADIPVVSSTECEQGYKDAGIPLSVSGNMFCAGFKESKDDACSGDSGGPFVIPEGSGVHERWYLEGIVSWGSPIGCGEARQYGGYSKIFSFIGWISQFI